MAKVRLSKSALQQERTQLQLYRRLLPSLDMKRRQLALELDRARSQYEAARRAVEELDESIGHELPMLASSELDLGGLVKLKRCLLEEENVVGVKLPTLRALECEVAEYSLLARPAWVDQLAKRLREAAELQMRAEVASRRIDVLARAVRQITQRVNLFERILIPEAKENIRRIQIFLGDLEREAVVRSKLAKARGIAGLPESEA